MLVPGPARERDNPFGPNYVLDALGATSRSVYPNPRVWRPLMVRLLGDMTPTINKIYISLNRTLADRGVLPDMKAALRARSEFRPADDKDLLPTFSRMMSEAGTLPTDIVVPARHPARRRRAALLRLRPAASVPAHPPRPRSIAPPVACHPGRARGARRAR